MERVVKIDNKEIRLKSNAATPIRYKAQFKKDYFADILKLASLGEVKGKKQSDSIEILAETDFEVFYNLLWIFAKTADNTIPPLVEWLEGFEELPIFDLLTDIMEIATSSMTVKKK